MFNIFNLTSFIIIEIVPFLSVACLNWKNFIKEENNKRELKKSLSMNNITSSNSEDVMVVGARLSLASGGLTFMSNNNTLLTQATSKNHLLDKSSSETEMFNPHQSKQLLNSQPTLVISNEIEYSVKDDNVIEEEEINA